LSSPAGAAEVALELQVALDLLSARLSAAPGTVRIVAPPALRPVAELWVGRPDPAWPVEGVLWLVGRDVDGIAAAAGLPSGGRVGALAAGRLGPVFDRLRGRPGGWAPAAAAERTLRAAGLVVEERSGIGAPAAPLWALLSRRASQAGRPDLEDAFAFRYRRALAPRQGALACDLVALVARRR
jgi:hypothetical protein